MLAIIIFIIITIEMSPLLFIVPFWGELVQ